MAEREIEFLREGLRRHVEALAVDIGPRTPFNGDSLERAAAYIQSAFEQMGLLVTEQPYRYYGQRVVNLLAATEPTTKPSASATISCRPRMRRRLHACRQSKEAEVASEMAALSQSPAP